MKGQVSEEEDRVRCESQESKYAEDTKDANKSHDADLRCHPENRKNKEGESRQDSYEVNDTV